MTTPRTYTLLCEARELLCRAKARIDEARERPGEHHEHLDRIQDECLKSMMAELDDACGAAAGKEKEATA